MKARELIAIHSTLSSMCKFKGPEGKAGKFPYAVHRNMVKIEQAMRHIAKANPIDHEEADAYDKKRIAILEKFCAKDEEGKPIIASGGYTGLDGNEEVKAAIEDLDAEFKLLLESRATYLEADKEMDFYKIIPDFISPDLNADDVAAIDFMIQED